MLAIVKRASIVLGDECGLSRSTMMFVFVCNVAFGVSRFVSTTMLGSKVLACSSQSALMEAKEAFDVRPGNNIYNSTSVRRIRQQDEICIYQMTRL